MDQVTFELFIQLLVFLFLVIEVKNDKLRQTLLVLKLDLVDPVLHSESPIFRNLDIDHYRVTKLNAI